MGCRPEPWTHIRSKSGAHRLDCGTMVHRFALACVVLACLPTAAAAAAPPKTTVTVPPPPRTDWFSPPTIEWQADQPATFQCSDWSRNTWTACASPYVPARGEIGLQDLFVRAVGSDGSMEADPAHVFWIADFPQDAVTEESTITGTYEPGHQLTCSEGRYTFPVAAPFVFEWTRNGNPIGTGQTYTVTQADVGAQVFCGIRIYYHAGPVHLFVRRAVPRRAEFGRAGERALHELRSRDAPRGRPCGRRAGQRHHGHLGSDGRPLRLRVDAGAQQFWDGVYQNFYLNSDGSPSTGDPSTAGPTAGSGSIGPSPASASSSPGGTTPRRTGRSPESSPTPGIRRRSSSASARLSTISGSSRTRPRGWPSTRSRTPPS